MVRDRKKATPGKIDDEVEFHLEMRARELVEQGVDPAEAEREARRRFGDRQQVVRDCGRVHAEDRRWRRRTDLMGEIRQDLLHGFRRLVATPLFTCLAVGILALGIGANTSIFSVLNAVVLEPLPYPQPDRLVEVWESSPARGWDYFAMSEPNFVDYRAATEAFDHLAAIGYESFNLLGDGDPERVVAHSVSSEYFDVLGVKPLLGRAFRADEDTLGNGARIALLGHGLWQRRFGADPDVVGQTIVLNDAEHTIIGVMPRGSLWIDRPDLFVPLRAGSNDNRSDHRLAIIGRLAAGVTPEQSEADLDAIAARLAEAYPDDNAGFDIRLMPLYESIVPAEVRRALYTLLGAVSLVLLIACANLSNLLLARSTTRTREVAIYVALGASRARVVRQFLTEATLLAVAGGVAGVALAFQSVGWFRAMDPARVPRFETLQIDAGVLLFSLGVAVLTGIVAGIVPAWQAAGADPHQALSESARGASASRRARRTRQTLLVAEVALSIVLLAGAGLLIRSFWEVRSVDPGFRVDNVLTLGINYPIRSQQDFARVPADYRETLAAIEALPGVEHAGATSGLPYGDGDTSMDFYRADADPEPGGAVPSAGWRLVTPGYFESLGVPLVRGRWFEPADGPEARHYAVISQSIAEEQWPGEDPIGKRFLAWRDPERVKTIIGVVGDMRERSLEDEGRHLVYLPFLQNPWWASIFVVVRTTGEPAAAADEVRAAVQRVMPDKPISALRPLSAVLDDTLASRRFNTVLLIAFALVALLLAAAGIYGVMAYTVAQQAPEIGIRMALGALPREVLTMVIAQGLRLVAVGVAVGTVAALFASRMLTSLLYGIDPLDPASLGVAALFLAAVAVCACVIPAWRATRVDVVQTLRDA